MHDLDIQIREYIDATSDPLTVDDVWYMAVGDTAVRPMTQRPRPKVSGRGTLIAGAAAAVVLIAVGLLPFLLRGGSVEPSATTIPTQIIISNPTTIPPSVPKEESTATTVAPAVVDSSSDRQGPPFKSIDLDRVEWTQIDLDPYVPGFAASPNTVYRDIDGYLISGNGVLTFSTDGRNWTTDPLSPELAEYQAFGSKGEWAVAGTGEWQQRPSDTRVLLHSDGLQWNVVDLPGSEGGWPEFPIVSGASTLVPQGGADQDFWVSVAGGPFEPQDTPWDLPRDMLDGHPDATILAAPDGGFIALLTVVDVHPDDRNLPDRARDNSTLTWAELWASPDGIEWQNQGLPGFLAEDSIGRSLLVSVRSHGGTLVSSVYSANAERRDTGETLLGDHKSTNGLAWTPESANPNSECWIQTMNMGYLCAGMTSEPETAFELSLSTDGDTWATIEPPEIDFESYGFVGGASHGGVGDLLYLSFGDMWIGHFEE
jgi:hypothetical protein